MKPSALRTDVRFATGMLVLLAALHFTPGAHAQDAKTLHARHSELRDRLASNPFQRPLVLESTQTDGKLKGDVYAIVAQPFSVVGPALQGMDHWCDVLMLHLNVKDCRTRGAGSDSMLRLAVGRKFDQPLALAYRVEFAYRVGASSAEYLEVRLDAAVGPLGTTDYRVVFQAVPVDAKHSFVHMSYSYTYGTAARLAMQTYLATIGRDKVGFSVEGLRPDGTPVYIGSMRGVVERNTMRYFLAIEAYLGATHLPAADQPEKRLQDWFAAVERYPRQLHEMDREDYLAMKRKELALLRTALPEGS